MRNDWNYRSNCTSLKKKEKEKKPAKFSSPIARVEDRLVLKKEPSPIEINFKRRKSGGIRRRLILSVSVPALWIHHRAELTGWQEKRTDLHSCKPFNFSKNLVHASSHESRDFPALFLRFNYPSNQISLEESSIIDLITTWFRTMIKFSKTVISPRFKFEFSLQRNGQCCQIAGKSGGDYENRKRKLDDSKSGLWLDGSVDARWKFNEGLLIDRRWSSSRPRAIQEQKGERESERVKWVTRWIGGSIACVKLIYLTKIELPN